MREGARFPTPGHLFMPPHFSHHHLTFPQSQPHPQMQPQTLPLAPHHTLTKKHQHVQGLNSPGTHLFSHDPHDPYALSPHGSPFQQSPPQLLFYNAQTQLHTWVVSHTQPVRHGHVDADGAHRDGMNGVDTTGVNGRGVNMDGARGVGTRSANAN